MMNFDQVNDRYHTYSTQWDFISDRFGASDILPFSISDTDFRAPESVSETCSEVISRGVYGYTRWNHHAYKGAISSYFKRRHDTDIEEDWIMYSPSVIYSVAKLLELTTEKNDGICVFEPMYDAFYHVIQDNERTMVVSRLINNNGRYEIDFEDLNEKASHCRAMLLCSPHNPTGRVWTEEELQRIVEICDMYDLTLISDEIHSDVVREGMHHIPILNLRTEKTYLVSSASKTFNIPGLGGSYAILPSEEMRKAFEHRTRYMDFVNSASLLSVCATIEAYTNCDDYIEELNAYLMGNFALLSDFCVRHPKLKFTVPEATYLAWVDVRELESDDARLQDVLVHQAKVGFMNGRVYGDPGYLRINLGAPKSKIEEGLRRFESVMDMLGENDE